MPNTPEMEENKTSNLEDMFRSFISTHHLSVKWDEFMSKYPNAETIVHSSRITPDTLQEKAGKDFAEKYTAYHYPENNHVYNASFNSYLAGQKDAYTAKQQEDVKVVEDRKKLLINTDSRAFFDVIKELNHILNLIKG